MRKLAHVAVAVRSLDEALPFYTQSLGLSLNRITEVPEQGVRVAFLEAGGSHIEILEPLTPQSGIARFLERRGEGLHHICFDVDDLSAELDRLMEKGIELIDRRPRPGAEGSVAFLHPRAGRGVLVELRELSAVGDEQPDEAEGVQLTADCAPEGAGS